jgi:hypothetical protein
MSTFDEREKGFERKFVNDQENRFRALSRRNRMLGEWAARRMKLADAAGYADALVKSELHYARDEDVLHRVMQDLSAAGLRTREAEVRAKMNEFLAQALAQFQADS